MNLLMVMADAVSRVLIGQFKALWVGGKAGVWYRRHGLVMWCFSGVDDKSDWSDNSLSSTRLPPAEMESNLESESESLESESPESSLGTLDGSQSKSLTRRNHVNPSSNLTSNQSGMILL